MESNPQVYVWGTSRFVVRPPADDSVMTDRTRVLEMAVEVAVRDAALLDRLAQ